MSDIPQSSKYTLIALLENRPGVLNRVVSLFRRRGFNLDSLTAGRTERDDISRMTLVIDGTRTGIIRRVRRNSRPAKRRRTRASAAGRLRTKAKAVAARE